ncbi:NUDIX hydrolase [Zymobacter sp. IVIA_12111.31 C1]|uniref:NUDIX hydrolase n=1 Tax=Zymobacter sp. IVIA_12111.31 C1 TaxID=3394854 RepID=UPI0039C08475
MAPSIIRVVAACLLDDQNQLLLVRKRNTQLFMMPGGKPEIGEDNLTALARELKEELDWQCDPQMLKPLGQFSAPAANEADMTVVADVFWGRINQTVFPQAEIEQLERVPLGNTDRLPLAPLQQVLMPALLAAYASEQ